MYIKDDYAPKENRKQIDRFHTIVLERLSGHPEGIGFNELAVIGVKGQLAKNTLRIKLDELILWEFVNQSPEDPRRGQKIQYYLTNIYNEYTSMLNSIKNNVKFLKEIFRIIDITNEEELELFNYLINYVYEIFSIPSILDSISTWNWRLIYNVNIMTSIFVHTYVYYMEIHEEIFKILNDKKHQITIHKYVKNEKKKMENIFKNKPELKQYIEMTEFNIFNKNNKKYSAFTLSKPSSEP